MKSILQAVVVAMVLIGQLSGCTVGNWERVRETKIENYTDVVSQYRISADAKQFVVLGKKHHYIFELSPSFQAFMNSSLKQKVNVGFNIFHLKDLTVTGKVYLVFPVDKLTAAQQQEAQNLGFKIFKEEQVQYLKSFHGRTDLGQYILYKEENMNGKWYLPEPGVNYEAGVGRQFLQNYIVEIAQYTSTTHAGRAAFAALATPVTLAADGALLLMAMPLFILAN